MNNKILEENINGKAQERNLRTHKKVIEFTEVYLPACKIWTTRNVRRKSLKHFDVVPQKKVVNMMDGEIIERKVS